MPLSINVATQVGHSALRTWAMGERAFEEESTENDLTAMRDELRRALQAGAIGFTTSRSEHHETSDNRPVASRLASWDEVCRLVDVMSELGVGIFEGAEGGTTSSDPEVRALASERTRALAVDSGVPLTFGIIATKSGGQQMLDLIDGTAAQGGRIIGQAHSRGISVLLSFKTKLPFDVLPEWIDVRALPLDQQRAIFTDPARRARLVEIAAKGDYSHWRGIGAMPRKPDFDGIRVYERGLPPNPTIAEVALARGVHPAEAMIDLALETNFDVMFIQPSLYPQDPDVTLKVLKHPRTVMTFSDSGAHLSQIGDSSIHTHLLGHWVRDTQKLTLEEAVRMITLAPALAWGFADRGLLREGMAADINVFDAATVGPAVPKIVHDLPGGGKRIVQHGVGFHATLVNGEVTIRNGVHTGHRSGGLLRNRLAAARP